MVFTHAAGVQFPVGELSRWSRLKKWNPLRLLSSVGRASDFYLTPMVFSNPRVAGSSPAGGFSRWSRLKNGNHYAPLAQSVEHQTFNLRVVGSSPTGGIYIKFFLVDDSN